MPQAPSGDAHTADSGRGSAAWRKRVAILGAITLACAGMLLLERSPASAASAPRVIHSAKHKRASVDPSVAAVTAASAQLKGAASAMTQTLPDLDPASAASASTAAASATRAATLADQVASLATSSTATPAAAAAATGQLQAALATAQAQAADAAAHPITTAIIPFCNFTIQIGPFFINIPRLNIHVQIGPFFIHFRAPCFLSGRIPTHIP